MDHRRFLNRFLAYERLLSGYLLAATGDFHEAEDLLQEVSVALWESFDRYDEARPFHAWALGIARHKVLDWKARRGRTRPSFSMEFLDRLGAAQLEEGSRLAERRPLLERCLESLPGHLRELVELRYHGGLRLEELALRLHRTAGALEVALVRVRRMLRDCIERKLAQVPEGSR